ncbi:MAG: histone deacetylase [Bacteroidia bacterium]|nr:histone deacetylase [Bacteroidia bacterium]
MTGPASPPVLHGGFPIGYADHYPLHLPPGHRFPAEKYALLKAQLLHRGIVSEDQLFDPPFIEEAAILRAHTPAYWHQLKDLALPPAHKRRIGLPLTEHLLRRAWASASITFWAARAALSTGIGGNLGGGTHHAYADRGEGFCVLNDVAISALDLLASGAIERALVIDLDVHQGNGTAKLLAHEPRVFTWSVHCSANYPAPKEQSDLDTELPPGTDDATYLATVTDLLPQVLAAARPNLVYYIAGSDVLAGDRLGRLAVSPEGMAERDRCVFAAIRQRGIPLVLLLGGGYHRTLARAIDAHTTTYALAHQFFT